MLKRYNSNLPSR